MRRFHTGTHLPVAVEDRRPGGTGNELSRVLGYTLEGYDHDQ